MSRLLSNNLVTGHIITKPYRIGLIDDQLPLKSNKQSWFYSIATYKKQSMLPRRILIFKHR